LVEERRRLASSLAAFAARLGLVTLRFFRTTRAAAMVDLNRSVTSSRFLSWLRDPLDTNLSRPPVSSREPSRWISWLRCSSVRLGDPAASHHSSIRVEDVLTCWPPGPPEREAR